MNRILSAFLIGGLFGLGIVIAGMANPAKVLNFFDIAGTWDPSLAFVMGGGLTVAFVGYRLVFGRRDRPVLEPFFDLPKQRRIDAELVSGAAVFGIGWGIAGFCPGGAVPALGLGYSETVVFLAAMVAGIIVGRALRSRIPALSTTLRHPDPVAADAS
ncbi:MAG: YeeE/YedE family protein [Rhizobiaceae bacterium]|nr:MAG: YeeE/YedE family protein [Rhizobiaceae bacterium]